MDLKYVKELIQILEKSSLDKLTIREKHGVEITLEKGYKPKQYAEAAPQKMMPHRETLAVKAETPAPKKSQDEVSESSVKSPMVGTFYLSESPDTKPFVAVGDYVKVGDPLCIIEAMKVMNEIKSDLAGKIVKICLEDGKPVEYGQTLFIIE